MATRKLPITLSSTRDKIEEPTEKKVSMEKCINFTEELISPLEKQDYFNIDILYLYKAPEKLVKERQKKFKQMTITITQEESDFIRFFFKYIICTIEDID